MKKKIKYVFVSILILMVFITCYSRYMEPERLVMREITVETDMDIEDCRIVFFTDTHFGELYDEKHIEKIVEMINGREADIVIFGGDLLDNYAREGSGESFILSGHTHGGQVSVPFFIKKLLPGGSDCFIKGFYDTQDICAGTFARMYVSSGIGLTKYPFRFLNVPEIIEVNLTRKE